MFQKLSCLPYVFNSVLACAKPAAVMHVFQKLFSCDLLCGLCLSLSSLTLPRTVRIFNVSLRSQVPQQQYIVLSFDAKAWEQGYTQTHRTTTVTLIAHACRGLTIQLSY